MMECYIAMVHELPKACKYIGNSVWKMSKTLMYVGRIICYPSYVHSAYFKESVESIPLYKCSQKSECELE